MPVQKLPMPNVQPRRLPQEDPELLPYILSGEIGKGSFATVYHGYHEVTREEVAVKSVSRQILTTKLFENLQSEIEILKRLHHRHVTQLIDIIRAERNIYLIMEFCAGGDLSMYIQSRGKVERLSYIPAPGKAPTYYLHPKSGGLDEVVVRAFLRQLARALKFLRFHNLIHRDIKPQNLLLTPASEEEHARGHPIGVPLLKLADFGFARVLPNTSLAETLCGSPLYMAPEILRYEKYDAKADLWSVGAVLYEMSVGRPPFRAKNHIELLKRIEQARSTVKFPDEDQTHKSIDVIPVKDDIKLLIRMLLKRHAVERASYEEFFKSEALKNSKFTRPEKSKRTRSTSEDDIPRSETRPVDLWVHEPGNDIPETHKVIPSEVLDPKANFPPSPFDFRSKGVLKVLGSPDGKPRLSTHRKSTSPLVRAKELALDGVDEDEEYKAVQQDYVLVDDGRPSKMDKTPEVLENPLARLPSTPSGAAPARSLSTAVGITEVPPYPPVTGEGSPSSRDLHGYSMSSRNASNALAKALNMASKRLFGDKQAPPSRMQGPLRTSLENASRNAERDKEANALLSQLEDLAQKTHIITHWCDDMFEEIRSRDEDRNSVRNSRRTSIGARKIRQESFDPDCNDLTCTSLYLLLMSFCQRGIDSVSTYQKYLNSLIPQEDLILGGGFEEALMWFRDTFLKCQSRILICKNHLPDQFGSEHLSVPLLIYNHAVQLSRTAARKELLDQMSSPDECEKRYEEALWCLYSLRDDIEPEGQTSLAGDQNMVDYEITRTKLRLHRCRVRMKMDDASRVRDARADHNLDDVQRFPPPWDLGAVAE